MSFYLIAETAFHHEGDKNYLKMLVDAAVSAGSDSIKFQVLVDLNEFMSSKHSAYEIAKNWVLTKIEWYEVFDYAVSKELEIVAMPLDTQAFELIKRYDIKYLEIHSVSFMDSKLLSCLDETNNGLIFGVGGRTESEIDAVVKTYKDRKLILMVGFQSFPTEFKDSQINKVRILKERYPECEIGYTDHSSFDSKMAVKSSEYAYLYGATVFEKHLTVEEGKERIDFQSAIGVDKFKSIKENLSILSEALITKDVFSLSEKEVAYRNRQKFPVTARKIASGTELKRDDLCLKMIDHIDAFQSIEEVLGKTLTHDLDIDVAIAKEDLE